MQKFAKVFKTTTIFLILGFLVILSTSVSRAKQSQILNEEVLAAQKAWSEAVVNLGKSFKEGGDYKQAAAKLVDSLYAYQTGQVLFKPTKTAHIQFRMTREGAISYFIGHNSNFPEDKGFALQPWTNIQFKNAGIYINGDVALAMGNYFFTPLKGDVVKVEYTFGYVKDHDGKLKIILHHSSLPYTKQ